MSELLDNSRYRIESLKQIVHSLHDGADPRELKERFKDILEEVGPSEIAAMESSLMAEGMPLREVQRMCDVHAAVLGDALGDEEPPGVTPGHPVHTLRRENEWIREQVERYREVARDLRGGAGEGVLARWSEVHSALARVELHYKRKEFLLFPFLEKAGISGPSKVMWGVDDEIRAKVRAAGEQLAAATGPAAQDPARTVDAVLEPMLAQVEGMTQKEDRILWPMALQHLSDQDWEAMVQQWDEMGESLVMPGRGWRPSLPVLPASPVRLPADDVVALPSGHLTSRQLTAMLDTLPVDLTFVGADGRVAYFSEGRDRIFVRNRAILGRRVQDCHPPNSVHIVEKIIADLRGGRRDVAEFWIQMGERFVHIRYFAVRDAAGEFLGVLEMTQDVAPLKELAGERRLLAEDEAAGSG